MASGRAIEGGKAFILLELRNRLASGMKAAQSDLKKLGQRATSIGKMVGGVGIAMGTPFAYAAMKFAALDDAMRATGAATQASAKDLAMLTETAKELGRTTSFTAVDVANLMTELGRAGFDPSQVNNMTSAVLNLARATGTDATLSAGIMSATIRQFGLEATDAARVADVLTAAANGSFNTVEGLGQAMEHSGKIASDMGMSLEETVAILGTLGNVGIQGSMAGTTLKRLSIVSAAELGKLEKIFGRSFRNSAGAGLPLIDMLEQITDATNGLDQNSRVEKMNAAFGLLGITGASAIGSATASTRELLTTLENAAGTSAKASEEMDAGLGGSFLKIQSAIDGAMTALGEGFSPALQSTVDQLTGSIGSVTEWIEGNQGLVLALAGTSAALIGTGAALVGVGVAAQVGAVGIGMLLSPIVLTTAAVGGLGFAFVKYTTIGAEALDWLSTRFGPLVDTAEGAVAAIGSAIQSGDLETAWELTTQLLELIWLDMTDELRDAWADAMDYVLDAGASTTEQVGKLFQALAGTLKTIFDQYKSVYDAIYNRTEAGLSAGANYLTGVETIGGPVEPKGSAFEQQFGSANASLNNTIASIREFGLALEAESAGKREDRTAERDAARKERQERINALRTSIDTSVDDSQKAAAEAKANAPKPEPDKEKPDLEGMLKKSGHIKPTELDTTSIETPESKAGDTATFSSFAAGIIGQGQSTPQKMLSLTERIARAVEAKAARQQGKADRGQERDARLQAKSEANRARFGTGGELSPADALAALWADTPTEEVVVTKPDSVVSMDEIKRESEANQSKAAETNASIVQARSDVGIGGSGNAASPASSLMVGAERMNKALEAIERHTGTSAKLLRKTNVARFAS